MQPLDGERLGRCAKLNRSASQETGQGHFIAVFRSRWEDRRERVSARLRLIDAFPGFVSHVSLRALLPLRRGRGVRRLAASFRGRRKVSTIHEVSGSAVQLRHYPVTVSARAKPGKMFAGTRSFNRRDRQGAATLSEEGPERTTLVLL